MSYGTIILNTDSRIQIDEQYSHFYPTSETPSYGTTLNYPVPGQVGADLAICRPPVGWEPIIYKSNNGYAENYPGGVHWHILRKTSGNIGAGGFGFAVAGPSGETFFSATNNSKMFDIVAAGSMAGAGSDIVYPSTSGTVSGLDKHWVVLNNTYAIVLDNGFVSYTAYFGYRYRWVSGTTGRIEILSRQGVGQQPGVGPGESFNPSNANYMIVRELP